MNWSMESTYEADVRPDDVYAFHVDPSTWGQWAHSTAWGRAQGGVKPGATVDVRVCSYPWTSRVKVRELDLGRRIVTEVRPFGVTITSTYDVTPTATGSRLHHTIALGGPLERGYRLLRGQYTRYRVEGDAASRRARGGGGGPSRRVARTVLTAWP